ncbi:hypothetical protein Syun_026575 [Stephania yunnanensis]|uniref:Uncharacterized protein n=1 Tax=Stephania yunnanensis TaxID=152371 RepID=A0AAP0EWH3_9MAGN
MEPQQNHIGIGIRIVAVFVYQALTASVGFDCLFSTPSVRSHGDDLGSLWHERGRTLLGELVQLLDDLVALSNSIKCHDQRPGIGVPRACFVFQRQRWVVVELADEGFRGRGMGNLRGFSGAFLGRTRITLFNGLVRNALGSCVLIMNPRLIKNETVSFSSLLNARAVLMQIGRPELHNMMTLSALPSSKQQRFAKETLEIFSIQQDNDFAVDKLRKALEDGDVSCHSLSGRLYIVIAQDNIASDKEADCGSNPCTSMGCVLIVENQEDCHKALKIVHQLVAGGFPEGPRTTFPIQEFNGYQSLKTVAIGEDMAPFEVLQMRLEWARWVVTWQCETMEAKGAPLPSAPSDSMRPPCPFPASLGGLPILLHASIGPRRTCYHYGTVRKRVSRQTGWLTDLLDRVWHSLEDTRWSHYRFSVKEELEASQD